jgi:hypothetical protein
MNNFVSELKAFEQEYLFIIQLFSYWDALITKGQILKDKIGENNIKNSA